MNAKNHRQNSSFQLRHFLAGSCHTADGAFALLSDLREARVAAIDNYHVSQLRAKARRISAELRLKDSEPDCINWLCAKADLLELDNQDRKGQVLYAAACDELAYIDKLILELKPQRKYAALPDPEAFESAQQEEWKQELIVRAENYLLTSGTIPADHFATMRLHPEFATAILPKLDAIREDMKSIAGQKRLLTAISNPSPVVPVVPTPKK